MEFLISMVQTFMSQIPSYAPFLFLLALVAFILHKAHTAESQKFNLFDLIENTDTGKGSLDKVGMLSAMLVVTWWFVDKAAKGGASWEDVLTYAGVMGLTKVAGAWIAAKYKV